MSQLCISQFKGAFIADIIFFVMLFLFALIDAKKGFIGCFFSFISGFVALLAALFLSGAFCSLTGGLFGLQGAIGGGLGNAFSKIGVLNIDLSSSGVEGALSSVVLPQFLKNKVLQIVAAGNFPEGMTLAVQLGNVLAQFIVTLICAVLLFVLVKLLMRLLRKTLTKAADSMTAIRKVNRLLGMLVGVLMALLITCSLFALLAIFPSEGITAFFNDTILLSGLYNNNPIYAIFGLFIS